MTTSPENPSQEPRRRSLALKPAAKAGFTPNDFKARIIADPEWYVREVLGQEPWDKQVDLIRSVLTNARTAVSGCVASSKTFASAMAVLAFMHAYGPQAECYLTAPTFRQVKKVQFKNVRLLHRKARLPMGGKLLETEWKLADDWFALGFSPKDPDSIHGVHAPNILVWIDEAQGVDQDIIEAAENALAGGNAHMLLTFNPNAGPGQEAYECRHSKRRLYEGGQIVISADDTPNVKAGRTIVPGMIEKRQRDEWVETYGWDSNFVRVKVRAIYPKQVADALLPIDWVEAAIHREASQVGRRVLGVDVARSGDDQSVIAPMWGRQVLELEKYLGLDGPQLGGRVRQRGEKDGAAKVFIDVIGVGSGVVDPLRRDGYTVARGINVAMKPKKPEKFADLRSEIAWGFREALDPKGTDPIGIPNDLDLVAQLSDIRYDINRQGKIKVESKDEFKARHKGVSPDEMDAVFLAHYASAASAAIASGSPKPVAGEERREGMRIYKRESGGGLTRIRDRFGLGRNRGLS